jgi:hypothetical protein
MFVNECTACRRRQLIFPSQFSSATAAESGGLLVTYTCWCGAEQTARMRSLLDQELTAA